MSGPRDAVPATAGFGSGAGSDPGPRHPRKTRAQAGTSGRRPGLPGWDRLRHGGLLLDATRLAALSQHVHPTRSPIASNASCGHAYGRDIGGGRGRRRHLVLRRLCAGGGLRPRRLDRRLEPRQLRFPVLGAARDHRRDGEAPPSVVGPERRPAAGVPGRRTAPRRRPGPAHREPGARVAARRRRPPRAGDERPAVAAGVRRARLRRLVRVGPRPVVRGRRASPRRSRRSAPC